MAIRDVEIGPEEIGDYWNPEKVGDKIEGNIYEFAKSMFKGKKQVRINLYRGVDENDEPIMTLLPSHAHLKRYYVNLERGDYIIVTVIEVKQPTDENGEPKGYPRLKYKVQVDDDKKVEWPEQETGYDVETVTDDYYAE